MKEVTGNLWTYPADFRVITTNGSIKKNGGAVMGRGCAYEAVHGTQHNGSWPGLPRNLGAELETSGNIPFLLGPCVTPATGILLSFPVKHEWNQKADLNLIAESAQRIYGVVEFAKSCAPYLDDKELEELVIVLPRPGCGNGGLKWQDVKPILEPILDDRFHVITFR